MQTPHTHGRPASIRATVNYFDPAIARGRFDVVEPERNLMRFAAHEVAILDMRSAAEPLTLKQQGFTVTRHRSAVAQTEEMAETNKVAQFGVPAINQAYYDELLPVIRKLSGARDVIPQATGLTVRYS